MATVEEVVQELDMLRREIGELAALNTKMADLLTATANAAKGLPAPGRSHDWSDLPVVVDLLKKQAARCDD